MASLDSANGPSATTRPFFPETILPSFSRGFPALALPCPANRSNQLFHWPAICCISSGERPLCQSVPRNISRYPFCVCALIIFFRFVGCVFCSLNDATNERVWSGQLFCVLIPFPDGEGVVFRVLANGEIAHLRHGGFGHADFAAEFLGLPHELGHRRHVDVIGDGLCRMLARNQPAVGCVVAPARVNVPVILHPGKQV